MSGQQTGQQGAGLSGMKWNFAGFQSNLIGSNAENVVRAIVSNPDLLKEASDEQLNKAKELLRTHQPTQRGKRQEKAAATAYVNTIIGERVATGSTANFDGGQTTNIEEQLDVVESAVEEIREEVHDQQPVNNFEQAATVAEAVTGKDSTTGQPIKTNGNVKPDAFGTTEKGKRKCKECGILESETLKKNARYSFCKGMCVNCYNKVARGKGTGTKDEGLSEDQIRGRIEFYQQQLNALLKKKETPEGGTSEGDVSNTEAAATSDGAPQDVKDSVEELAEVTTTE